MIDYLSCMLTVWLRAGLDIAGIYVTFGPMAPLNAVTNVVRSKVCLQGSSV